jgi:tRNA pseudouridine38-40 synthase
MLRWRAGMRNVKLVIEYDGTNYSGWQSQKNAPTIQDTVEAALSRILNQRVRIVGSGRTDSGVHALGQVAHFKTCSPIALPSLRRGANSLLPPDILIRNAEEAEVGFHARYSATSRMYEYRIWNGPCPSVFLRRYVWWVRESLDVDVMSRCACALVGRHDFSSFQGADEKDVSPLREVLDARFQREGEDVRFIIQANSFLRHMVRNIVGTLVEVGRKRISLESFETIFSGRDRTKAGITAPASGLFLLRVCY